MAFLAKISFLDSIKGGRFFPPQTGFKPALKVGSIFTSCFVDSVDPNIKKFDFNQVFTVKLELMFPEEYENLLSVGVNIGIYEGNKRIAEGEIIEII